MQFFLLFLPFSLYHTVEYPGHSLHGGSWEIRISTVRRARPGAIENKKQEDCVRTFVLEYHTFLLSSLFPYII